MGNEKGRAILGMAFVALFLAGAVVAGKLALFAWSPAEPGSMAEAFVLIRKGQPPSEITRELVSTGAIQDTRLFMWLGRLTRQWPNVKAGEYRVSPAMSPAEIFSTLRSGISVAHPVTVREGENMYEIAADIEAKGLAKKDRVLELCRDRKFMDALGVSTEAPSLEGYLYPETYFFNRTLAAEDMIRQMVQKLKSEWGPDEEAAARTLGGSGMTKHQVLTLASIIEKETGASQERPLISSVFHNRLRKRMRLQSDPTTIYGIWERYRGNLSRADLLEATPYNTYAIPALPPGPISNPGREAIQAALHPTKSDYLYFVSHNDGTHQFSGTLEAHNAAVRQFQIDRRARDGKSWRDLSKRKTGPR